MGGPIDMDFRAIWFVIDLYVEENKKKCFEKVIMVGRHMIKIWNNEAERERNKGDKKWR
jgi:hypothetical protein